MIKLTRKCSACGGEINLIDDDSLPIGVQNETLIFCKECLFHSPYFKQLAIRYVNEHTEEIFKEVKK